VEEGETLKDEGRREGTNEDARTEGQEEGERKERIT
jgi:hypothetical protein